jgi:hypothetical protein
MEVYVEDAALELFLRVMSDPDECVMPKLPFDHQQQQAFVASS